LQESIRKTAEDDDEDEEEGGEGRRRRKEEKEGDTSSSSLSSVSSVRMSPSAFCNSFPLIPPVPRRGAV
jgi:hypothetical protein